jgi:integral membrane protein (TIGR01906 family)
MNEQTVIQEKKLPLYIRALTWLVSLLTPVILVLTFVRLLMTPVFLQIEYRMPGFPADFYGFTLEDRLYWSRFALDYLVNGEDISYLGDLKFENGLPLYNQRELTHMVDVQVALRKTLISWYAALGLMLLLAVYAWYGSWWEAFRLAVGRGGWLTVFALAGLMLFVLLSFGVFFVAFHNVFFEPGTWIFYYSDTLIRLFPERFWRDIFIYVGLFALAGGLALGLGLKTRD